MTGHLLMSEYFISSGSCVVFLFFVLRRKCQGKSRQHKQIYTFYHVTLFIVCKYKKIMAMMLLQKNIECGAVFCVCDFRVACFYVCAAFGFASVPYAPMPVLCPNTPKERIPLQVSVYQQNKHVLNSLCKLLSIRCLTCSKIQAIYFKIQGTYFKICALYFCA